jgi:hypothetical protein
VCNLKGIGLVVGLAKGNVLSARAKNSENWCECHDLMDVKKEVTGQEVDTPKSVI